MNRDLEEKISLLKQYVEESQAIVFFGGAGVSTESGIPDFRSVDGLYHQEWKYPPETIISHSFFVKNPEEFYRFYRKKLLCPEAKPNAAHRKLAELEKEGKLTAVVTQNIDGLHQLAGSKRVYELHGSVHRNYCQRCGKFYDMNSMLHSEESQDAAAAASSSRMSCCTRRAWMMRRSGELCMRSKRQIC